MAASEDDKDVLSFSCIDADAREELAQLNARRARRFGWTPVLGLLSAMILLYVCSFHGVIASLLGVAFGVYVIGPILRSITRLFTRPLKRNLQTQFTIALSETALEASARGRTPKRVPLERIVEIVADDRLRIALDDGTLVTLPCVLEAERLTSLADELNAALRRRRARVADYRGARIATEPEELAETEDEAARPNVMRS